MFRLVSAPETIEEKTATKNFAESKGESRAILDQYYSVQFSFSRMDPTYLFKLRNLSDNGLCILVKQDSTAFKQLDVGDILDMEFNPTESSGSTKILKTKITSKNCFDRFKGHSLVELSIIDN
jgi:hypothetical protein